jgi:hypothetical protein
MLVRKPLLLVLTVKYNTVTLHWFCLSSKIELSGYFFVTDQDIVLLIPDSYFATVGIGSCILKMGVHYGHHQKLLERRLYCSF